MSNTIYPHGYKPNILLLGNGINLGFSRYSWEGLIKAISSNNKIPSDYELKSTMPLQAILVTENQVEKHLKDFRDKEKQEGKANIMYGSLCDGQAEMLRALLSIPFDGILTTNYSYELEMAAAEDGKINDYRLGKLCRHTDTDEVSRVESKYLLHTYNQCVFMDHTHKIWHIHGEAKKPGSIILGHYQYANLLQREIRILSNNYYEDHQRKQKGIEERSWLDAFILGNVYILGFGYDISEFDMWWLLDRKKREHAEKGKVFFFEPAPTNGMYEERLDLLRIMGANICTCDEEKPDQDKEDEKPGHNNKAGVNDFYQKFYWKAIEQIKARVS